MTRSRTVPVYTLLLATAIASSVTPALASVIVYKTPNTTTGFDPVSVSLNGTLFTNKGLQGVGKISASFRPNNQEDTFGSASGLAIGNWAKTADGYSGTFYTLPDRGYNNTDTGLYSDYAARIYTLDFDFTPYTDPGTVSAQDQIKPTYISRTDFTYRTTENNVPVTKVTTGLDPGNNTTSLFGQTVPFVPSQTINSTSYPVNSIALDSEALVLKPDGSGYIGDEYGPNVYYFNSKKEIIGALTLPEAVRPHLPPGTLNFESTDPPANGRRNNQGMEGVSLSPDGSKLYALLQSATVQDSTSNQQTRLNTRLLVFEVGPPDANGMPSHTLTGEYVVQLPIFTRNGGGGNPNRTAAQSEIIALDNGKLLVLSRDGNGLGSNDSSPDVFKSVLLVDTRTPGATNLAQDSDVNKEGGQVSPGGNLKATIVPLSWVEVVNMLNTDQLAKFLLNIQNNNVNSFTLSEKWESMALVPALDPLNPLDYFLFIANDNDFLTTDGYMRQADGSFFNYNASVGYEPGLYANNDTYFLAYRVTIQNVPEPSVLLLFTSCLGLLGWFQRRKQAG